MTNQRFSKNISGFIRANNEKELYEVIEQEYLPKRFGNNWERQFDFAPPRPSRIDYFVNGKIPTLIEVKNWFITKKDMLQIMGYLVDATDRYGSASFHFILIAGGIDKGRRELLEPLGIEIVLTKEVF